MAKKETAIALISADKALVIEDAVKKDLQRGASVIQSVAYSVGKRIQALKDANAHLIAGDKNFDFYLDRVFSEYPQGHAQLKKFANAYHHLSGIVAEKDMPAWTVSAVGEVKWAKHDAFAEKVKNGDFTAENFTQAMAKAFNKDGETEVVPTFALFDGPVPVVDDNGTIALLTAEEVKDSKPNTDDKSMTVCTFTFKDNMDRKIVVYAKVNKANLCITSSEWYREFTAADVDAFMAKQEKQGKKDALIAELKAKGVSEDLLEIVQALSDNTVEELTAKK